MAKYRIKINSAFFFGYDMKPHWLECELEPITEPTSCQCVYEHECHGIEMIKAPSGKEFAIGGTNHIDRFQFCPWCGKPITEPTDENLRSE